jgi:hypothetical protein
MQTGWTLALTALTFVFLLSTVLSSLSFSKARSSQPLESYLLASGGLSRSSIVSLLLSSSFGLNALFYATWLGYAIGGWALIIQAAWSVSFFLLTPYTSAIRRHKSLHDLLGRRFGADARVIAGLCSLIGIMYFIGWEVGIGKATINGLIATTDQVANEQAPLHSEWLISGIVFGCLLYTVLGGLRGNALADIAQNLLKIVVICFLTYLLFKRFVTQSQSSVWSALFPPLTTMVENLGWWGLITNVMFNLAWQFVDMSTWQSIIGGAKASDEAIAKTLRLSGLSIFIIPNFIATLLGASLAGTPDITPDNILVQSVSLLPSQNVVVLFLIFVAVAACVMSLIDGYFLAAAYALLIDIIHPRENLADLDADPNRAKKLLLIVRVGLVAVAVVAIWGVSYLLDRLGLSLFDFVYIVIITQLALIGPVLIGLATNRLPRIPFWVPIICALIIGFGCVAVGTRLSAKWLVDGAGTFTIIASCLVALIATKRVATKQMEVVPR